MAESHHSSKQKKSTEWVEIYRAKTPQLLMDATVLQNELFDRGDLTPYLTMLCKISYQNSRNLLLLMARFPEATCVSGFKIWQQLAPDPNAKVVRPEHKGNKIYLLAPFTDSVKNKITWIAVPQFDISQVNVTYKTHQGPYDPLSPNHKGILISALRSVLGEYYQISVSTAEDPEDLEFLNSINTEGRMLPGFFLLHPNRSEEDKLRWITVSTCRIYLQYNEVPSEYINYLSLCCAHCLFTIWGVPALSQLSSNPVLIRSVPTEQRSFFLDIIQRCVYTIQNQVSMSYD